MISTIQGDIIKHAEEGKFDFIVHGCNCFHTMGSGLAGQLVKRYPLILVSDKTSNYGDREKLGTWTSTKVICNGNQFTIINAYTQYFFGLGKDVFEYEAFDWFLNAFGENLELRYVAPKKMRVAFPKIGAGLAKGDWGRIYSQIETFSENVQNFATVTLVDYQQ